MTARWRVVIGVVLATVLVASCGGDDNGLRLGVRKVALSLAFADADKAEPVDPKTITIFLPAPEVDDIARPTLPSVPKPRLPLCGVAPPVSSVVDIVRLGIAAPPAAGTYGRHNKGSLTITAPIQVRLPFPLLSSWAIEDVKRVAPAETTEDPLAPVAAPNPDRPIPYIGDEADKPMWEFRVRKTLTRDFVFLDTYRLSARRLLLLQRETITPTATRRFTPSPPITFIEHAEGEAHTWRSAGVDTESSEAMYVEGTVERREPVDVCGTFHDAYRISMVERTVNLQTGETTGTADGDPNVYHVATQLGGLILQEDVHFTQTITTTEGLPAVVVWDYVSTQNGVAPDPPVKK